jgi:hypothetical protein
MSTINSDEHSAKRYVRGGPGQPLAPEHRDKPGASSYQQGNSGKSKGESVSGAEWRRAERTVVQRRRTVSTDLHVSKTASVGGAHAARGGAPLSVTSSRKNSISFEQVPVLIAARVARFAQLRRARPCSATGSSYSRLKPCFSDLPRKKRPSYSHSGSLFGVRMG